MAERRFFCERIDHGRVALSPDEAHHARSVVRVRKGDAVRLFDGRGAEAAARVDVVGREGVELMVERIEPAKAQDRPLPITLAVAMPKASRQDVLIEKCTELGAGAIWPIITERSVVRPRPSRLEHWRRVSIAAAKQSGRSFLPEIQAPDWFGQILPRVGSFDLRVFGSTEPQAQPWLACLSSQPPGCSVLVVIGPEGGFTPDEQAALSRAGAIPVSFGRRVLRVETAAITALAVLAASIDRSGASRSP